MRTPAGTECRHYYEDFQRGASLQECRAPRGEGSLRWEPSDCGRCPVPGVLIANSSPDLGMRITISKRALGRRRVDLECWCELHAVTVAEPAVGCVVCSAEADDLLRRAFTPGD